MRSCFGAMYDNVNIGHNLTVEIENISINKEKVLETDDRRQWLKKNTHAKEYDKNKSNKLNA